MKLEPYSEIDSDEAVFLRSKNYNNKKTIEFK